MNVLILSAAPSEKADPFPIITSGLLAFDSNSTASMIWESKGRTIGDLWIVAYFLSVYKLCWVGQNWKALCIVFLVLHFNKPTLKSVIFYFDVF